MTTRRACLAGLAALAGAGWLRPALAMGRIPLGGQLAFHLPHDTSRLDPFDLSDPLAAILGHDVFEPVYRLDQGGNPYPSLAAGMPEREGRDTRVRLRDGLQSGRGRPLLARDLVESVERSRRGGGRAVLLGVPRGRVDRNDGRVAIFRNTDPVELARALASPIVPLVSTRSTPTHPDGTGAFVAKPSRRWVTLERNTRAARGPAYLRRVSITAADDMKAPLRAFEARRVDLGWLGAGLHQPRQDARGFDLGAVGWIVLRTGREAGPWSAPGVAQRLLNAIPPARLAHLALGPLPPSSTALPWGGPPCKLLASSQSAHLREVGKTLASILSNPGHEVELATVDRAELASRRASGAYALMVDLVRPVGPAGMATLVALATADDPARAQDIARHPPQLGTFDPRVLARTLQLGVAGGLLVAGAHDGSVVVRPSLVGAGWDLGGSFRRR